MKIVVITNHNAFDLRQYNELKDKVRENCDVWPEIELDAFGDQKKDNMGKAPAISEDDLVLLRSLVPDSTKVFTETAESSIGVLVNNDFHALAGSDVRNWNDYKSSMFSDLRLPVSSFVWSCYVSGACIVYKYCMMLQLFHMGILYTQSRGKAEELSSCIATSRTTYSHRTGKSQKKYDAAEGGKDKKF